MGQRGSRLSQSSECRFVEAEHDAGAFYQGRPPDEVGVFGHEAQGFVAADVGLGAGLTMAQQMMNAAKPAVPGGAPAAPATPEAAAGTKFCLN